MTDVPTPREIEDQLRNAAGGGSWPRKLPLEAADLIAQQAATIAELRENGDRLVRAADSWKEQCIEQQATIAELREQIESHQNKGAELHLALDKVIRDRAEQAATIAELREQLLAEQEVNANGVREIAQQAAEIAALTKSRDTYWNALVETNGERVELSRRIDALTKALEASTACHSRLCICPGCSYDPSAALKE